MAEMPEHANELGYEAGRIYSDEILSLARELSDDIFGSGALVKDFFRPYIYLDGNAIGERGLDKSAVATAIALGLEQVRGIGGAVPNNSLKEAVRNPQSEAIRHNHHEQRSGDIYVFQQPYWYLFDRGSVGVMHGSPWAYDTHVNIIFSGPGIKPAKVDRLVHPIDVAPTLSALLGLSRPAAAQGKVLVEVLRN